MFKQKTLCLIVAVIRLNLNAQYCDLSQMGPLQIHHPFSVTVLYTSDSLHYLCGPNTVLQAPMSSYGNSQFWVLVSSGSTLNLGANTWGPHYIWIKNGGVLNIQNTCSVVDITYEAGATINNPFNIPTITHTCMPLIFPEVNCSALLVNQNAPAFPAIKLYPNPFTEKIFINSEAEISEIIVTNLLGQCLVKNIGEEKEADLSCLSPGTYFLEVKSTAGTGIFKLLKQ